MLLVCQSLLIQLCHYSCLHIRFEANHEGSKRVRPEQCTEDDITSDDIDDILVDPEEDSLYSIRRMVLKHGAVLVPSVLSKETASKLRETIQSSHHTQQDRDDFYVLEQEGRRRRLLNFNEDEVFGRALNEIATHEIMRPLINEIAGPDAALVGLFSITNTPESEAQPWHSDNQFDKSRRQYPDDYHRVYSIVLALQDTTEEMGTTAVCLGTHHCKALSYEAAEYCIDEVEMKTGDSLVFDADIFHRGGAHYDLGGEDRVMLFVVVAASESPEDPRWLPTRYFQLRWDMFGHSIHDFVSPSKWTVWQALGLKRKQNVGYSFISYVLRLVANKMVWRFQFRGKNYAIDWDTVEDFWQQALLISSVVTCVWVTWWGISRFAGTVMAKGLRSNAKKTL